MENELDEKFKKVEDEKDLVHKTNKTKELVELCLENNSFVEYLGPDRLFYLCHLLIVLGRFLIFKELIINIVSVCPEIIFSTDELGNNLFMIALDNYIFIKDDIYAFIKNLHTILNNYRRKMLLEDQYLPIFDWDIENTASTIPEGEDEDEYDERNTILNLAFKTGFVELIEFCIYIGCWKISHDDKEPYDSIELFDRLLYKYNDGNEDCVIHNFRNKLKILVSITLLNHDGINCDISTFADLAEYMMEDDDDDDEDEDE
jgi:hypothetical protein